MYGRWGTRLFESWRLKISNVNCDAFLPVPLPPLRLHLQRWQASKRSTLRETYLHFTLNRLKAERKSKNLLVKWNSSRAHRIFEMLQSSIKCTILRRFYFRYFQLIRCLWPITLNHIWTLSSLLTTLVPFRPILSFHFFKHFAWWDSIALMELTLQRTSTSSVSELCVVESNNSTPFRVCFVEILQRREWSKIYPTLWDADFPKMNC